MNTAALRLAARRLGIHGAIRWNVPDEASTTAAERAALPERDRGSLAERFYEAARVAGKDPSDVLDAFADALDGAA